MAAGGIEGEGGLGAAGLHLQLAGGGQGQAGVIDFFRQAGPDALVGLVGGGLVADGRQAPGEDGELVA